MILDIEIKKNITPKSTYNITLRLLFVLEESRTEPSINPVIMKLNQNKAYANVLLMKAIFDLYYKFNFIRYNLLKNIKINKI